ncbi:VOC family protein [Paraburkholderia caffeinitolerans]|uniref:VOC family protein n=1 Tax=Paraburkholderia caffeinitolerans TaxID=1723730 RepID=UPI00361F2919
MPASLQEVSGHAFCGPSPRSCRRAMSAQCSSAGDRVRHITQDRFDSTERRKHANLNASKAPDRNVDPMDHLYTDDDTGNLVLLEHVNLRVPDPLLATAFYVSGLGLTRDPFMMTGVDNMWINIGRSQIHLPTGKAQRLRGSVGIVVGERDALVARLQAVAPLLGNTRFGWTEHTDHVEVTCPWGNRYHCLDPQRRPASAPWSKIDLGMAFVKLDVPVGSAAGIAGFYHDVFGTPVDVKDHGGLPCAVIDIGTHQQLLYAETQDAIPEYDGHHIAIYAARFSGPYARLAAHGVAYREEPHQFRFASIVNPESGARCFELEHEVRSLHHPLYARPLVNRNPQQTNRHYQKGADSRSGAF